MIQRLRQTRPCRLELMNFTKRFAGLLADNLPSQVDDFTGVIAKYPGELMIFLPVILPVNKTPFQCQNRRNSAMQPAADVIEAIQRTRRR